MKKQIQLLSDSHLAYSNMSKPFPCFRLQGPNGFSLNRLLARYTAQNSLTRTHGLVSAKRLALANSGIPFQDEEAQAVITAQTQFMQATSLLKQCSRPDVKMLIHIYQILRPQASEFPPVLTEEQVLLLENLFSIINNHKINTIDKAYLAYCQFLLISPFASGNQIIARVLWQSLIPQELELLSPALYQLAGNELAHQEMLDQYRNTGINLDHPAFLNRSKRWGEELKLKMQQSLEFAEAKINNRARGWAIPVEQHKLLAHLWQNPVIYPSQYRGSEQQAFADCQKEINQLMDAGLLLSSPVTHSHFKKVLYCPIILDCISQIDQVLQPQVQLRSSVG